MLGNFEYSNPTKLFFGNEAQKNLVQALMPFGKKVLLTYGGGFINSNGVYYDAGSYTHLTLPAKRMGVVYGGAARC